MGRVPRVGALLWVQPRRGRSGDDCSRRVDLPAGGYCQQKRKSASRRWAGGRRNHSSYPNGSVTRPRRMDAPEWRNDLRHTTVDASGWPEKRRHQRPIYAEEWLSLCHSSGQAQTDRADSARSEGSPADGNPPAGVWATASMERGWREPQGQVAAIASWAIRLCAAVAAGALRVAPRADGATFSIE